MEEKRTKTKKALSSLVLAVLLVGLGVGIVLVGRQQILRTRAETDITQAFNIKDGQGNTINCSNNICDTSTLDVTIELKPDGLDILKQ